MPRIARASAGKVVYHVMNRGSGRTKVFTKPADFEAFLALIALACRRVPMRVLAACLMPNHFHLVLWPRRDGDLSRWMQWLLTNHVRRHHRHRGTSGQVWQGRFKAFPIQRDEHLLIVLRYVERNALRAKLVKRAQDWRWGTLYLRGRAESSWLSDCPIDLPRNWTARVNEPQTDAELEALRQSVQRGRPFGSEKWQRRIAAELGLESTMRPRGRPRKTKK